MMVMLVVCVLVMMVYDDDDDDDSITARLKYMHCILHNNKEGCHLHYKINIKTQQDMTIQQHNKHSHRSNI
jgi:hypothetical protein